MHPHVPFRAGRRRRAVTAATAAAALAATVLGAPAHAAPRPAAPMPSAVVKPTAAFMTTVAYATSPSEGLVMMIDVRTGEIGRTVHVPQLSASNQSLAVSPDGMHVWAATDAPGLAEINVASGTVSALVTLPSPPSHIKMSHDGSKVWALVEGATRSVVDVSTTRPFAVGAPISTGLSGAADVQNLELSPDGTTALVPAPTWGVAIVDLTRAAPAKLVSAAGQTLLTIAYAQGGNRAYVADNLGALREIDPHFAAPRFTGRTMHVGAIDATAVEPDPSDPNALYATTDDPRASSALLVRIDVGTMTISGSPLPLGDNRAESFAISSDDHNVISAVGRPGLIQRVDLPFTVHPPDRAVPAPKPIDIVASVVIDPVPQLWQPAITVTDRTYSDRVDQARSVTAAAGLLAGATFTSGRPIRAHVESPPPNSASFSYYADGAFDYTPKSGFTGIDTFTFSATDGVSTSDIHTVTIDVEPERAPVAVDDGSPLHPYVVYPDTPRTVPANIGLLANDSDPNGDAITPVLSNGPEHGDVKVNVDGSFTYTPKAGYKGPDSFEYYDSDGTLDSNTATVSLYV